MPEYESVAATANAITTYLLAHPLSADTLECIHRWWIQWPEMPPPVEMTLAALEQLEAAGQVERMNVGGRVIWRAHRGAVGTAVENAAGE